MPDLMALVGSCQIAIAAFIGKKPSFLLKRSVSWVGVQDELLVPGGEPDETSDDLFAKPAALVVRVHCDVGNVRTVEASASARPAPTRSPAVSTKHANLLLANTVMSASGGLSQSGASRYSFESSDQATAPIS